MYLKNDKIVATITSDTGRSVVLRASKLGTGEEYILDPTAVVGWTDGTAVRRDTTPRMGVSGDFPEPAVFASRLIAFSGTAVAATTSGLQRMRDDFTGVLGSGSYGTVEVTTTVGTRLATVGLEGTPSWVQQSDTVASWRLSLYAPDAYLYGPWNTVTTGAGSTNRGGLSYNLSYPIDYNIIGDNNAQTVKNNGNVESWPKFVVRGDFYSGFSILNGRSGGIVYNGMVTTQAPVTIDMGKGAAIQNGVDKTTFLTRRDWFSIGPDKTIAPEFRPNSDYVQNGTGWCDILYRDTWI